jgi:hypothetical protein
MDAGEGKLTPVDSLQKQAEQEVAALSRRSQRRANLRPGVVGCASLALTFGVGVESGEPRLQQDVLG